ncbi:MAG TPA: hypothetical protein DCE41_27735 [Cytophagales bacterium]|nr:hypothetical protein [Cytophagales bacterium]HAP58092.1 hypothetical protein [Cytophagales bacterium]
MLDQLKKAGQELTKAEQKEIRGGEFGDVGLPDVGPSGGCYDSPMSPECQCLGQGGRWNSECSRCDTTVYFDNGDCGMMLLP